MKAQNLPNYYIMSYTPSVKLQKKTTQDIVKYASDYFNAYNHLQFNIGFPNTEKSKEEIESEVQRCLGNICSEKNIPEELKPSLVVIDSIQYAPTRVITAKLREDLPEKKLKADIFASYKKQPKDMATNEFLEFVSACTNTPSEKIKEILEIRNNSHNGFYSPFDNTITYYTDNYRQGLESINTTIKHEFHHFEEAIKRNSLPQKERDEIVRKRLLLNITEGESREIFKQFPTEENLASALMEAPILNKQTRKLLADLAKENLFTDDYELFSNMQKYSELLHQEHPNENELLKAKANLGGLAEKIEKFSKTGKIYDKSSIFKYFFGLKDPKEKNRILFDYLMSVEFRYQIFRDKEIEAVPTIEPSEKFLKETEKDFDYHISSSLANYVMNIPGEKNRNIKNTLYWNYYSCPEEVDARISSGKDDITMLKNKLSTNSINLSKNDITRMQELLKEKEKQYKEDCELKEFYALKEKINENPKNIRLKIKYFIKEKNIQNMKSNHIFTPIERFTIQAVPLTTLSVYTRNVNLFRNNKHPIISLNRFYQNLPRSFQTILFIPAGALISVGAAALAKYIIKSKKE